VTPINRDRVILGKIGWANRYEGLEDDRPVGEFSGLRGGSLGHEAFNFKRAPDGQYYGYFRAQHGNLNLKRIDSLSTGSTLGGVTVIWVSRPLGHSLRVVGWYRNATVFASTQTEDSPWIHDDYGGKGSYVCTAPAEGSALLPEEKREAWKLPKPVAKRMGHTNIRYPHLGSHSGERASWVGEMGDLIDRIETSNP
jgi:hypothetical protein